MPLTRQPEPIEARPDEHNAIEQLLERLLTDKLVPQLTAPDAAPIALPHSLYEAFKLSAQILARGDMVSIVPVHKLLTTQEAANLLNVSREYVRQQIRDGKLPCVDVGNRHRIRFSDLMTYRANRDTERRRALAAMTAIGVEAGGYFED
jgi:excisionase family DNA binding protein